MLQVHLVLTVSVFSYHAGAAVQEARVAGGPITVSTSEWAGASIPMAEARSAQRHADTHHFHVTVHPAVVDMAVSGQPSQLRAVLVVALGQWVISKFKVKPVGQPLLKVRFRWQGLQHHTYDKYLIAVRAVVRSAIVLSCHRNVTQQVMHATTLAVCSLNMSGQLVLIQSLCFVLL